MHNILYTSWTYSIYNQIKPLTELFTRSVSSARASTSCWPASTCTPSTSTISSTAAPTLPPSGTRGSLLIDSYITVWRQSNFAHGVLKDLYFKITYKIHWCNASRIKHNHEVNLNILAQRSCPVWTYTYLNNNILYNVRNWC